METKRPTRAGTKPATQSRIEGGRTSRRLLRIAAQAEFAEKGFDACSTVTVARQVGVPTRTANRLFKTKFELMTATIPPWRRLVADLAPFVSKLSHIKAENHGKRCTSA